MTIHPTFSTALGFCEAFRRLGFSMTSLTIARDKSDVVFLVLMHDSQLFACECGKFESSDWKEYWAELLEAIVQGAIPRTLLDEAWNNCPAHLASDRFLKKLREKGITPPDPIAPSSTVYLN